MEEKLLQEAYEKSKDYLYEDSLRFNLLSIIEKIEMKLMFIQKLSIIYLVKIGGKKTRRHF